MHSHAAVLHAGLLARKGEARPSALPDGHMALPARHAAMLESLPARREPASGNARPGTPAESFQSRRVIELPRHLTVATRARKPHNTRTQIHARLDTDLHVRVRIASVCLGRTQQDLVASALAAYLGFIEEDVLVGRGDARSVGG